MFIVSLYMGKALEANYAQNASITFTATGNNIKFTIVVASGVFGLKSGQAFAGVLGFGKLIFDAESVK